MRVESVDLIAVHNAMVDLDVVAPAVMITGFHDHAISGGIDRRSVTGSKVHSSVRCACPAIRLSEVTGYVAVAGQRYNESTVAAAGNPAGVIFRRGKAVCVGNADLGDGDTIQVLPVGLIQHFGPFDIDFRPTLPIVIQRRRLELLQVLFHDFAFAGVRGAAQFFPLRNGLFSGTAFAVPVLAAR